MAASFKLRDADGDNAVAVFNIIGPDTVDRAVLEARIIGPDGEDRVFFRALSAGASGITVDPDAVSGIRSSSSTTAITSRETTVTVTGGVAPYSYLWSQVSGDTMTILNSTTPTASFGANVDPGDRLSGVFKCSVTDAAGVSADSPEVTATLFNIGGTL